VLVQLLGDHADRDDELLALQRDTLIADRTGHQDPDHVARVIQDRPAGVAGAGRRLGLEHRRPAGVALDRGQRALSDGGLHLGVLGQPGVERGRRRVAGDVERRALRDLVVGAHRQRRQVPLTVQLEQGDVLAGVALADGDHLDRTALLRLLETGHRYPELGGHRRLQSADGQVPGHPRRDRGAQPLDLVVGELGRAVRQTLHHKLGQVGQGGGGELPLDLVRVGPRMITKQWADPDHRRR
jgi:hypothetical protein